MPLIPVIAMIIHTEMPSCVFCLSVCVCMCAHGCVSVWQCTCMHVCVHVCVVVCVLAGACPGNVLHCDLWPGLVGDVGG